VALWLRARLGKAGAHMGAGELRTVAGLLLHCYVHVLASGGGDVALAQLVESHGRATLDHDHVAGPAPATETGDCPPETVRAAFQTFLATDRAYDPAAALTAVFDIGDIDLALTIAEARDVAYECVSLLARRRPGLGGQQTLDRATSSPRMHAALVETAAGHTVLSAMPIDDMLNIVLSTPRTTCLGLTVVEEALYQFPAPAYASGGIFFFFFFFSFLCVAIFRHRANFL
jgi:hypothetical protein